MKVNGVPYRSIWVAPDDRSRIFVIDQRWLPHRFEVEEVRSTNDVIRIIEEMHVRGAPLIGAAAAFGLYFAAREAAEKRQSDWLGDACSRLARTRPTAVNLKWALDRAAALIRPKKDHESQIETAFQAACDICDEDVETNRKIGGYGLSLLREIARRKAGTRVNVLTHCNAGWLATVDRGTATAPLYAAQEEGIALHVWVDETRPRNQGSSLTAWELENQGIPCTVVVDNAGGHLMQHGEVDVLITGADRVTRTGDVCNKIGTYLKALSAHDNGVPFYAAVPGSTIDFDLVDGIREIPIEMRDPDEVRYVQGQLRDGGIASVLVTPARVAALNYGFDVTPARLVTGLLTERGLCDAEEAAISALFPDQALVLSRNGVDSL